MSSKKVFLFLFFLFINLSFSQEKENPNIIKKEIKSNSGKDIIDMPSNATIQSVLSTKNYNKKTFVYYNGKFFPDDTINKKKRNKNSLLKS